MVKADIWVEGIADQKFLADVLSVWFGLVFNTSKINGAIVFESKDESRQIDLKIRAAGSVNAFISEKEWQKTAPDFQDNHSSGGKNLVIADMDDDFSTRKKEIADTVKGVGFHAESDLFLWPDHQPHDEKSDLEKLLVQIVSPNHQDVLDCFDGYESCLKASHGKTYVTPNRKAKIFSYSEALSGDGNERKRDYTNPDHWQLDHTKEPLKPLHEFLKQHLGL